MVTRRAGPSTAPGPLLHVGPRKPDQQQDSSFAQREGEEPRKCPKAACPLSRTPTQGQSFPYPPPSLCQRGPQAAGLDGKPVGRAGIMGPRLSHTCQGRRRCSICNAQAGVRPTIPAAAAGTDPPPPRGTWRTLATWAPRSTSSGPRVRAVRCAMAGVCSPRQAQGALSPLLPWWVVCLLFPEYSSGSLECVRKAGHCAQM